MDTHPKKHNKIGTMKFRGIQNIEVYLSRDERTVYLFFNEDIKVMTSENFSKLFKQTRSVEPIPPGVEPKEFPPLPKAEGLEFGDFKQLY